MGALFLGERVEETEQPIERAHALDLPLEGRDEQSGLGAADVGTGRHVGPLRAEEQADADDLKSSSDDSRQAAVGEASRRRSCNEFASVKFEDVDISGSDVPPLRCVDDSDDPLTATCDLLPVLQDSKGDQQD